MNNSFINQVNEAINYIMDHLEEDLTVERVAEHCAFSKYYFNRIFRAVTGESVYSFIKRLRIERSAFYLKVDKDLSITEIAARYGLSSSNYSTAFRDYFNVSPSEYRKMIREGRSDDNLINKASFSFEPDREEYELIADEIMIKELPDLLVIYERYMGHYNELTDLWDNFCSRTYMMMNQNSLYLDISYDDPMISDEDSCIYDLCMTVENGLEDSRIEGFDMMTIKGGKYAVYDFSGPIAEIGRAYQKIFSVWLPGSSVKLDDRRIMSVYDSQLKDNGTLEMGIYVPIK